MRHETSLVKGALFEKYASEILRLTTQLSVDDFWSAVIMPVVNRLQNH